MNKKDIRKNFRNSVFNRDNNKCRFCGKSGNLDAHHITNRNDIPNGGYVKENGISLCEQCHINAEKAYMEYGFDNVPEDLLPYRSDKLYLLIGSSYENAIKKSIEWNAEK
jgi:5-methylcytosine-specific restriction endonuclease McrA